MIHSNKDVQENVIHNLIKIVMATSILVDMMLDVLTRLLLNLFSCLYFVLSWITLNTLDYYPFKCFGANAMCFVLFGKKD